MEKSVVSIVKGTDTEKMVEEALDLIGGVKNLIRPGTTVVVKPNAGHNYGPETSVCTSPEAVAAVIKVIRKANPKQIILAEAAAIGMDTMNCFEVSGILKAAQDAGVDKVMDIKKDKDLINIPIRKAKSEIKYVLLPRWLIEAEHIVNLPIYKAHLGYVFTSSLKNIKGLVSDKVHYQMHQTDLLAAMTDMWTVIQPDINLVDMIRPAEGYGPHYTFPVTMNCLVASKDPVAADATAARMTGADFKWCHIFPYFYDRGLGQFQEDKIELRGKKIKDVFTQLWYPFVGVNFDKWPEYRVFADGACSSCRNGIPYVLETLKALGEYDRNAGVTIVAGKINQLPKVDNPKNLILMGDCTKKWRDKGVFGAGCPQTEGVLFKQIVDRRDIYTLKDVMGADETDPEGLKLARKKAKEDGEKFLKYTIEERKKYMENTARGKSRK